MKIFIKFSLSITILAIGITIGLIGQITALAASTVNLGTANTFAVLAGAGITNTGTTTITGDIGSHSTTTITGSPTVIGTNHAGDATTQLAKTALTTAYGNAAGQPCNTDLTGQDLGGLTLTPGVYCFSSSAQLTGTLTLNGSGDPNAIFIFQIGSTLTTASSSIVSFINSAQSRNVFWQVGSSATLGTSTSFKGTILALTSITLTTGVTVEGRMLAQNGAVTLDTNTIIVPTALHLRKTVTLDNGGTALITAWTLTATGTGGSPTSLSGTTPVDSGSTFKADTYALAESGGPTGYTASTYSCVTNGGGAVVSNSITLAAGDEATCTINNNDIAPALHLRKIVNNNFTGTATVANFTLTANGSGANDISGTSPVDSGAGLLADTFVLSETNPGGYTASGWVCVGGTQVDSAITLGINQSATCTITNNDIDPGVPPPVPPIISVVKVPSPLSLPAGPGSVTYTYTLHNIGTVPVTDITMVDDSCTPAALFSGDANSNSILELTETWTYTCTTTLAATHTNTVIATGWANGLSATDTASSTVVVGIPVIPPLIHVTKVPSPLTLQYGGGSVTYTERITNPGTEALTNVHLTDDKCTPMTYISGDTNSNSKIDSTETWTYTCTTTITETTTNTATATGDANGLTATDSASATVVVDIAPTGNSQTGTINVVKLVINDNGGTKKISDFQLFVNSKTVSSGVTNTFSGNSTYSVHETSDPKYTATFSGDCDSTGHINLTPTSNKFCIITNNDIGTPTIIPPVPPLIDVVKVPSPLSLPNGAGTVTYTYTLKNIGTVPVTDITMVGDTCSPIVLISGDTNSDKKLDVNETWVNTCSTKLSKTHTNTVVTTGWANGLSTTDIASATVVVGKAIVPPLIHVTKVPTPLTLLSGGGVVTYVNQVTNPGTVALNNVKLVDDKCAPINYVSGDTNKDLKLDPTETWKYVCSTNLTATTTNVATATGSANGMTVKDLATATVVVATALPSLPNTGVEPVSGDIQILVANVIIFGSLLVLALKNKKIT